MIKKAIFKNKQNLLISGFHHFPEIESNKGIILCHGMQSNKKGCKVTHFAKYFSALGYHTLRFDFRYVGDSKEAKFEEITLSGEVEDLEAAVNYFKCNNINEITLIGSSLGGCVAAIFASRYNINKLVTIAAPFLFDNLLKKWFNENELEDYKKNGYKIQNQTKINSNFAEDALTYNFDEIFNKIKCSVLIIHGEKDTTVGIENSHYFFSKLSSPKEFFIIENGDHKLNDKLDILSEKINEFIVSQ